MQLVSLMLAIADRPTFLLTLIVQLIMLAAPLTASADAAPAFLGGHNNYGGHVSQKTVKQGQTVVVEIEPQGRFNPLEPLPTVNFNDKTYKVFRIDKRNASDKPHDGDATAGEAHYFRSLVSVPALLKPGVYGIAIAHGSSIPITVTPGGFGVQRLRLPPGKDNFISSPGEEEMVQKARNTVSEEKFWNGVFKKPSQARVSSTFGLRRVVNGKLLPDYFHSGIDYAGATGSPVKASQRGKVLIARTGWRLHGGTVAIDHGQGVVTFHIHLSKVLVKEGQVVEAGQEIGKIGSTGRASGPHLHFSMYVSGNATNPIYWYEKEVI